MNEDNVILIIEPAKAPFLNPASLAQDLYPGVAVSVQTSFYDGSFRVESFIVGSSSISVKKITDEENSSRRLLIGIESLPDGFGEVIRLGLNITVNEHYQVSEINSDTEVGVKEVKVRLFGPNPSLAFLEGSKGN
jgi:hypothetical protein